MRLLKALAEKKNKIEELSNLTDVSLAKKDPHAKREPRDCGLTVHPGIGCDLGCVYCYIKDMGFPTDEVKPYPLDGKTLALAIALNPNIGIGKTGSYLAVGSVTEPFHPLLVERTIDILRWLNYLGNYTQISYKMVLPDHKLEDLLRSAERNLSVLISISTLKKWKVFEPRLPPPELRLEMGSKIRRSGRGVSLFLRPILPGITDKEIDHILETAYSYDIKDITIGGLRVTERIYKELVSRGVTLNGRLRYLPKGTRQVYVYTRDIKDMIIKRAERLGMRVLYTACDANARHHGEVCWDSCKWNRELCEKLPPIDEKDLKEGLKELGVRLLRWNVREPILELEVEGWKRKVGWIVQMAYRRQVIAREGKRTWKYL